MKVRGWHFDLGVEESPACDRRLVEAASTRKDSFMGASLFDQVKPSMRIYKEEILGPVLSLVRCRVSMRLSIW